MYHYISWHTGDGVATDLTFKLPPGIHSLVHDAIVLAIHALGSGTLATLAEVHDGVLGSINSVDLNLVVGVLDDGGGHGVVSLADEHSIGLNGTDALVLVTLLQLSPLGCNQHKIHSQ